DRDCGIRIETERRARGTAMRHAEDPHDVADVFDRCGLVKRDADRSVSEIPEIDGCGRCRGLDSFDVCPFNGEGVEIRRVRLFQSGGGQGSLERTRETMYPRGNGPQSLRAVEYGIH